MRETRRALSSVADVSLALVLVVAAIGVFVGFQDSVGSGHDPTRTAHTTETLSASTLGIHYSLEPMLETRSDAVDSPGGDASYDSADLQRTSHGPVIGQVARAALGNTRFGRTDNSQSSQARPLGVGPDFATSLETEMAVDLVDSQFRTNVSAVWEPFDGSAMGGQISVGQPIPQDAETTLVRVSAASELPARRERAMEAVRTAANDTDRFHPVARLVADAIVNHTFSTAQRDIERGGVDRAVVVSRYLHFADAISGVNHGYDSVGGDFSRSKANTAAMNALLVERLTNRFERTLSETYETPTAAANAVSTGETTVSITTWNT